MRRWIVLVLLALVLAPVPVVVTATAAHACSCALTEPDELIDLADAVVTGTITDIDRPPATTGLDPVWYTLAVDEVFLGEGTETMVFSSAADGASCGLENIETGTLYVVLLQAGAGQEPHVSGGLVSNLCSGTQPYDGTGSMTAFLAALDGHPPDAGSTGSVPLVSGSVQPWLIGGGLALVAAAVVLLALRRRRRKS